MTNYQYLIISSEGLKNAVAYLLLLQQIGLGRTWGFQKFDQIIDIVWTFIQRQRDLILKTLYGQATRDNTDAQTVRRFCE